MFAKGFLGTLAGWMAAPPAPRPADLIAMPAGEHHCLLRHLGSVQTRCTALIVDQARRIEALEAQAVRRQGELIRRQTEVLLLREQLAHQLGEADEVICRTGCISHGGYWLDDENCRRKGAPCDRVPAFDESKGQTSSS